MHRLFDLQLWFVFSRLWRYFKGFKCHLLCYRENELRGLSSTELYFFWKFLSKYVTTTRIAMSNEFMFLVMNRPGTGTETSLSVARSPRLEERYLLPHHPSLDVHDSQDSLAESHVHSPPKMVDFRPPSSF